MNHCSAQGVCRHAYSFNFTRNPVKFHNSWHVTDHTIIWNTVSVQIGRHSQLEYQDTPHLKWKKLSNNSSWDFEHVLDTMDDYWVGQDENFCPESTPTRWRCYHFSKKWSKSKFDTTLSIKKPFVTPKFCDRNFSQMHHFEDMNFLSPLDSLYLL